MQNIPSLSINQTTIKILKTYFIIADSETHCKHAAAIRRFSRGCYTLMDDEKMMASQSLGDALDLIMYVTPHNAGYTLISCLISTTQTF